jgi:ribosomal-protein-alanine N-acetyltransferase
MPRATTNTELTTDRLRLRWLTEDDCELMLAIWNDPGFIRHVRDRGIRTLEQARQALQEGILKLYSDHGYGPYRIEPLDGGAPMGLCGLFKRDYLEVPDIGYTLLPEFRGHGYALEAARAVLAMARDELRLPQLKAIVSPDNPASVRLLEKLGMRVESGLRIDNDEDEVALYSIDFSGPRSP